MTAKRLTSAILFHLLMLTTVIARTGQFIPSDRFSSGLINSIYQDQYGYMWIATENGLNKFDGYRFTTYYHNSGDTTSLGSNIVTSLYQDKQGQLWVGTRLGVSRYDYDTDRFVHYTFSTNEHPHVNHIIERKNGELLFGTSGRGLYALKDDILEKVPDGYTTGSGNWYYNQMMEDSQGRFWKCGYGDEVTMMDDKAYTRSCRPGHRCRYR